MKTLILTLAVVALLLPLAVEAEENGAEGEFQFLPPDSIFVWDAPREDGSQVARFEGFLTDTASVKLVMSGFLGRGFMFMKSSSDIIERDSLLKSMNGKRVLVYANTRDLGGIGIRIITDLVVFTLPDHRAVGYPRYTKEASTRRPPYSDEEWEKKKKYIRDETD